MTIPTTTLTEGATPVPTAYFQYCPQPTEDDLVGGYEWEMQNEECMSLLEPYCYPTITESPRPSTTFPASCIPSNVVANMENIPDSGAD